MNKLTFFSRPDGFEFTFINAAHDKISYAEMLNKVFIEEYGFTIYENLNFYNGYHSTLVCKHDKLIIGGLSAYIIDEKRRDKLPMEKRGINLRKYVDLKSGRYAEICRGGVLKEYRKYKIYPELMKKCLNFGKKIGCKAGFWVARKYYAEFLKYELEQMGVEVKFLDRINHTQNLNKRNSITFDYYLSGVYLSENL